MQANALHDVKFQLMCQNVLVAQRADVAGGWEVIRHDLLPHNIDFFTQQPRMLAEAGVAVDASGVSGAAGLHADGGPAGEDLSLESYRTEQFLRFLANRVLPLNRAHAEKLLDYLDLPLGQSIMERARIALMFRAVSVCDSWWVKFGETDLTRWENVRLLDNELNPSFSMLSLFGDLRRSHFANIWRGDERIAEVLLKGTSAKGLFRNEKSGQLFLYKADTRGGESRKEASATKILSKLNVYAHLPYEFVKMWNSETGEMVNCSKCKVMSSNMRAIVHASECDVYMNRHGVDAVTYARFCYLREFAQMVVVDYLLSNADRHHENWGYFRDMLNGKILGLLPLYDHNRAFDKDLQGNGDMPSPLLKNRSMREAAKQFAEYAGLKAWESIDESDFPDPLAHEVFVERCEELRIPWKM